MTFIGLSGAEYEMEKVIVFRNNKHVVIYRSVDELLGMVRSTVEASRGGETNLEIEVLYTAVEQPRKEDS